jgi:hypothetical protein
MAKKVSLFSAISTICLLEGLTNASEPKSPQTPIIKPIYEQHRNIKNKIQIVKDDLKNTYQVKRFNNSPLLESYECPLSHTKFKGGRIIANLSKQGIITYFINANETEIIPVDYDWFFVMKKIVNDRAAKRQ